MAERRVGTSGWHYDHWAGDFYPPDVPRPRWFERYATCFSTVEINNTFYRLPKASAFEGWRDQAPAGFLYAVKLSRYGTHLRKLLGPELYAVLRRHQAALCVHDLIERHPRELTASWTYLRFHGDRRRKLGGYSAQRLRRGAAHPAAPRRGDRRVRLFQ